MQESTRRAPIRSRETRPSCPRRSRTTVGGHRRCERAVPFRRRAASPGRRRRDVNRSSQRRPRERVGDHRMARDTRRPAVAGSKLVASGEPFVHALVQIRGSSGAIEVGGRRLLTGRRPCRAETREDEEQPGAQPLHGRTLPRAASRPWISLRHKGADSKYEPRRSKTRYRDPWPAWDM